MSRTFYEYFRCPDGAAKFFVEGRLSKNQGYFQFGKQIVCYGNSSGVPLATNAARHLADGSARVRLRNRKVGLPFNLDQIANNLRFEHYAGHAGQETTRLGAHPAIRNLYYFARPFLPVPVRSVLQRIHLHEDLGSPFPHWPVDRTVDSLFEKTMGLAIQAGGNAPIPFIWFWPDGAKAALILTHDVESSAGLEFCPTLMDLDNEFGFYASFQLVPEERYTVTPSILQEIKDRGFEVNVHDLNHDGNLFRKRDEFVRRATKINEYAIRLGTRGFRSGALYRNPSWYHHLSISYDMSIPNVGHLDPQNGGCCTIMPYFIGDIVEIPVTETQDYSLFHILNNYSTDLWKQQTELILRGNGLISFIVHPDYVIEEKARNVYRDLLRHLADIQTSERVWATLPSEIARWWKLRSAMKLVRTRGTWEIVGEGKERAKIAYACLVDGRVQYTFHKPSPKSWDSIAQGPWDEAGIPTAALTGKEFSEESGRVSSNYAACVNLQPRTSVSEMQTDDGRLDPMRLLEARAVPSENNAVGMLPMQLKEAPSTELQSGEQPPSMTRRPLRVCMVAYSFYEGDNRVIRYAETLAKCGHHVDVFALQNGRMRPKESQDGVHVFGVQGRLLNEKSPLSFLWRILLFLMRSMFQLSRNDLREKYDLIHIHSVPDFLVFSALLPRLRGTPVILDIHDILPEFYASKFKTSERSLGFRFLSLVEWFCAKFSSHVIIANHIWQERLLSRSVEPGKCTVVLNFPDRSIFCRSETTLDKKDRFTLLYPGTLNWHQGVDVAIRAFAKISSQIPTADFHIYGGGPSKSELLDLVKQFHLENRVFLHSGMPLRDIAKVIEKADLGIVPKRKNTFGNEAFSTKIFEFMAMGVPVIVSDTKVDRYYFNDSVVRFFRGGDEEDLASCMLDLIQNPEKRQALVKNASVFIDKNSWTLKKQEYLDLVSRLTEQAASQKVAPAIPVPTS